MKLKTFIIDLLFTWGVIAALILLALSIVSTIPVKAQTSPTLPSSRFEHGRLVDLPVVFIDGEPFWSREFAFLAVKLDSVPEVPEAVDYLQTADYFRLGGGESAWFATLGRTIWTDEAANGWLILPLRKPCEPGDREVLVGRVTVCPPRKEGEPVDACVFGSPTPLYSGEPEETVTCAPATKRRSVRQ